MRGVQGVCVCMCVGGGDHGVKKFPLSPPLPPPQVHKCVPAAIVTLSYSRTEGLKQTGSKQCLAPFVSRLPFFFSPPSQSTGLLCIDFPHSAARRPLSAVLYALFWLFLSTTSPTSPSLLWHSLQCENAVRLLTGCNSLKTPN